MTKAEIIDMVKALRKALVGMRNKVNEIEETLDNIIAKIDELG
jgi:hypothetical protein